MISLQQYPKITLKEETNITGIIKKEAHISKSFLTTTNKNTFFIATKEKIYSHLSNNVIKKKENGYLLEILFHGLNYNAKRLKPQRPRYSIDVHKSELFIFDENAANTFKSRIHKRRIIFFSYDQNLLINLENKIKNFKVANPYTGKGLYARTDSYILKEGKKRK
jgi:hypothetical protein